MSTQNEQYQQALNQFRLMQTPLNSGVPAVQNCCSRLSPIPISTQTSENPYQRVLRYDGTPNQGDFAETWSTWTPGSAQPNPNPGGRIIYNPTNLPYGAYLSTQASSDNSRAELRDAGNHASNIDAVLPLGDRKYGLEVQGTALQGDDTTVILIGFYKGHRGGASITTCDGVEVNVGPIEIAVAFTNINNKWHCLVRNGEYTNYTLQEPNRRDVNCWVSQITHLYDTGLPIIHPEADQGNNYGFYIEINQDANEAKFYINTVGEAPEEVNLIYTASGGLPYYPSDEYAIDPNHNLWRGVSIRKCGNIPTEIASPSNPVSAVVGEFKISHMYYYEYFSQ